MAPGKNKSQMGRPSLGRSEYVEVRMSPDEKRRAAEHAAKLGLTMSDFVRLAVKAQLGDTTITKPKK